MLAAIITAFIAINVLVIAHEFGHFLMAKRKGICVEIFSIGFGPRLLGFTWKGTQYRISLLLFGGYVKFKGDELDESTRNIPGGFYSATPFSRIVVCVAGGFFNVVLAWILYTIIFFCGKPVLEDFQKTIVGDVKPGSIAEKIGIMSGDRILGINGKSVDTWEELVYAIAFSKKDELDIEIDRGGELVIKRTVVRPDPKTGIKMLGVICKKTIVVQKVFEDSPAEQAGLLSGDRIVDINGKDVYKLKPLIKTIRLTKKVVLIVKRNGAIREITVIPKKLFGKEYGLIGFIPGMAWTVVYPKPWEQFWTDLARTWQTLSGLITRNIPVRAISGPVGIIGIIGISIQIGWIPLLSIIALISLNLGIVNLLPIPVLDGGHIMFNILEAIRKRPLSIKTIEKIQNVFTGLLILLALYVTYNDILRWFR